MLEYHDSQRKIFAALSFLRTNLFFSTGYPAVIASELLNRVKKTRIRPPLIHFPAWFIIQYNTDGRYI